MKSLTLIILLVLPAWYVAGQEDFYHKTFTTDNGLPHNHVYSITQDSTGFLWIATWDGLSRYDGYEFRNYQHKPNDSTSLAYFICEKVVVDFENNVWACGPGGISKYVRGTDNFKQFFMVLLKILLLILKEKCGAALPKEFTTGTIRINNLRS